MHKSRVRVEGGARARDSAPPRAFGPSPGTSARPGQPGAKSRHGFREFVAAASPWWQGDRTFVADFDHAVRIVSGADFGSFELHDGGGFFYAARQ
ncbi:MAG: hypothetical protein IPK26_02170 [Planctomycetes bacterium]|nr:hypothetical protein [Planctomycetota bacterium]